MADLKFRVAYMDRPFHEAFMETATKDPALELVCISTDQPREAIVAALAQCHGYYTGAGSRRIPATAELVAQLPSMLMVASPGAGYDAIDVDACTRAGIAVVNQAGGNAEAVAEHAVGMILAVLKRMPEAQAAMRAGTVGPREEFMGRELAGRTVGIVGLGHVGTRTAQIVKAFNCRVLASDPYLDEDTCAERGAKKVDLPQLLAESDIVTLHCPLTPETRGLFGAAQYAAMREGAVLVTTCRGNVHDETALLAALESGHIAGAGLDVWEEEPPPADHPLLAHPAVLSTVHTAGVTHESRTRVAQWAAEAFSTAAAGRVPPRVVNPEVVARYAERWSEIFGRPFRRAAK